MAVPFQDGCHAMAITGSDVWHTHMDRADGMAASRLANRRFRVFSEASDIYKVMPQLRKRTLRSWVSSANIIALRFSVKGDRIRAAVQIAARPVFLGRKNRLMIRAVAKCFTGHYNEIKEAIFEERV